MANRYPVDFKERAVRLWREARPDHRSDWATTKHVASMLGIMPETLRLWKQHADVSSGLAPGTSEQAQVEIKRLKKQIRQLEQTNAILRSASVFFATELGRPSSK